MNDISDETRPKGSTPVPDPTVLTTQQLVASIAASREIIETRLNAMDIATALNKEATDRIPAIIGDRIGQLRTLVEEKISGLLEKFQSIATQFKERDIRAEREARDNKVAVDAAFAAQKEAAAKQDEANAKAIEKSERATAETIKTNQELSLSKIDALTNQMNDLKGRLDRGEGQKVQAVETKGQQNWFVGLFVMGGLTVVSIIIGVVAILSRH